MRTPFTLKHFIIWLNFSSEENHSSLFGSSLKDSLLWLSTPLQVSDATVLTKLPLCATKFRNWWESHTYTKLATAVESMSYSTPWNDQVGGLKKTIQELGFYSWWWSGRLKWGLGASSIPFYVFCLRMSIFQDGHLQFFLRDQAQSKFSIYSSPLKKLK